MGSIRGLGCHAAVLLFLWGCADRRQVQVWSMPGSPQSEAAEAHQGARPLPPQHPWSPLGGPDSAPPDADRSDPRARAMPRGDLPETGLVLADGFWRLDERAAYREARELNRGILIDFFAQWCFPCVKIDRDTLTDPMLRQKLAAGFVPVRIDVTEETTTNREQLERYRVYHLPAVLILDPDGRELERIDHYVDVSAFLDRLQLAQRKLGTTPTEPATVGIDPHALGDGPGSDSAP